jgi:hypothetical protein
MATYYVRNDGNDSNSGLGPAVNQAWQTITKALGATGITSGDTVYVAPGTYRSATGFTIATSYTSPTQILADPTAGQFSGIPAGPVRLSVFGPIDTSAGTTATVLTGAVSNITISDFEFYAYTGYGIYFYTSAVGIVIQRCVFFGASANNTAAIRITSSAGNTIGTAVRIVRNIVYGFRDGIVPMHNSNDGLTGYYIFIQDNFIYGCTRFGILFGTIDNYSFQNCWGTHIVTNNTLAFIGNSGIADATTNNATTTLITCANNLFLNCAIATQTFAGTNGITQVNSRIINCANNGNYPIGGTVQTTGIPGIDIGQGYLHNLASLQFGSSTAGSPNTAFGTTTNALPTDLYNVTWSGTSPDAGAITYRNIGTINQIYQPTERTNNSFTVSPNTTNRTELIYLGAKGLTHTTPSLSASYVRAGAIRTAITLVSQTPNGSWTSGGFCEIDSVNMPGIYRIDVPNALFVAGAESAMLQLTGLNTSNGAVVHYNMAKVQFDLSQNVPLTNTAHSIGDALNAARAQGFGKWQIVGNTMNIYAEDGITLVKSFNLDSGSYPTQRM